MDKQAQKMKEFREGKGITKPHSFARGIAAGVAVGATMKAVDNVGLIDNPTTALTLGIVATVSAGALAYKMHSGREERNKAHSLTLSERTKDKGGWGKIKEYGKHAYNQTMQYSGTLATMAGAGFGVLTYLITENPEQAVEMGNKLLGTDNADAVGLARTSAVLSVGLTIGRDLLKKTAQIGNFIVGGSSKNYADFSENKNIMDQVIEKAQPQIKTTQHSGAAMS